MIDPLTPLRACPEEFEGMTRKTTIFYVKMGKIFVNFQPNPLVVENKNRKFENIFYAIPNKDLR